MRYFLARLLAKFAHRNQIRKYTGEPYDVHTLEVSRIVRVVPHDVNMLIAALLHDTVEDTWVKLWMIRLLFWNDVASLVDDLTDVSTPEDGNRVARKAIDRAHTAAAQPRAKTIKLADWLSNGKSIMEHDTGFAKTFFAELALALPYMKEGNPILYRRVQRMLAQWESKNKV